MKDYKYILAIILILCWVLTPIITKSQIKQGSPKNDSYTLDVIEASPSNFEVNNGTVLFSGSINSFSDGGKMLKEEHTQIAEETINLIEELSINFGRTKQLNEAYYQQIANQLTIWKEFVNKNKQYQNILGRELQVFNTATNLQFQENIKWSVIDSTLNEIEQLNNTDKNETTASFTKSTLYTKLLLSYIDLNEFYKEKYKEIITLSTLSHATQENPNLNLPQEILNQIKPLHDQELKDARILIYDQKNNIDKIKEIGSQTQVLNDFYKKMDQYSISEIDKILTNLKHESKNLTPNATNFLAQNDISPLINDYIKYYENVKVQLEEQILAQEIKEASIIAIYDEELTQLAYTGMLNPGMEYAGFSDWASSAWNGVKTGVKVVSGAGFAVADYATGKISETICEVSDKASAMYDKGMFSDEYKQWSQAYDKAGENSSVVSIKDTFAVPLMATLKGDDKNGLGQAAVNKAQQSFQTTDKYLEEKTGTKFFSQVALNTVTCGGYGLAKDFTTINDANASTADKVVAGAGIILAVAPMVSGANAANDATKSAVKSTVKNVSKAADDIGSALVKSNAASDTLKNATKNLASATDDMIKAAGPNLSKADILYKTFNAVSTKFDDAIINKTNSMISYNQSQQQMNNTIKISLINVQKETLKDSAVSAIKSFASDHTLTAISNRVKDMFTDSLETAIKKGTPFFGETLGNAIGVKDLANFTLTNFVNNTMTNGITTGMQEILKDDKKDNKNPANSNTSPANNQTNPDNNQSQSNNTSQPTNNVVPLLPADPNNLQQTNNMVPLVPAIPYGPQPQPTNYYPQTPGYPLNQQQITGYTTPQTDPALLQQYLQGQQFNNNNKPNIDPNDLDNLIGMQQQNQQNFNDNRGQQNANNQGYVTPQNFDTDLNQSGGTNLTQHVQQLSTQTGQWQQQNQSTPTQPNNQPTATPTPSSNTPSNIPIGEGVPEQDRTNGIDDDNDGVIDEGPSTGTFQMAIHDTGGDKDDQWEIKVDGQSIGRNNQGKTRFWDLNLSSGQHTITATGVAVPDNVGTYTIWFGNSKVISGPSLSGSNLNQGVTFTWTIQVP
ncbi:MAG: hypothetical protein AB7V50_05140 [Vampirovibrionia bacterium]